MSCITNDDDDIPHGCEMWSFKLREEYRSRSFVNRVLMMIFGPKLKYGQDTQNFIMASFMICTPH
jgi:hypothetical protein